MRKGTDFNGIWQKLLKREIVPCKLGKGKRPQIKNKIPSGFYEVLLEKARFSLLKKHRKLLELDLGDQRTFYEFKVLPSTYLLTLNNNYYPVENVSDLTSLFPDNVDQLVDFAKKRPRAQLTEEELKALLNFLNTLRKESTSNHLPKWEDYSFYSY